jgi:cell division protein FtsB
MDYKRLLLAFSVLLNIVLAWHLIWGGHGFVAYKAMEQELLVLNDRMDNLARKNISLSREIKLLQSDDKYIEQILRKRLNFVRDNEIWYIFPEGLGAQAGEGVNEAKN